MKEAQKKEENLRWMREISAAIKLSEESTREIIALYEKEYRHIDFIAKRKFSPAGCVKILFTERLLKKEKAYTYLLAAVILKAKQTHKLYRKKGISDEIFYDTMGDIRIWSENFRNKKGFTGIDNIGWIQNHLGCKIFRLGRLQFQPFFFYLPPYVNKAKRKGTDIKIGAKVLNVHIPQGEKLLREECEKSFRMAEEFFSDYHYRAFICESWLLCERNREFMSEDSNIIRFGEMFEILGSSDNPSQAIERIFGKKEDKPDDYPESTILQRQCKAYIISGGTPGTGFGIIRRKN